MLIPMHAGIYQTTIEMSWTIPMLSTLIQIINDYGICYWTQVGQVFAVKRETPFQNVDYCEIWNYERSK